MEKLSWIKLSAGSPYFLEETGCDWTPVGQNDAITWPDLSGLFQRRNVQRVEEHLAYLAAHGVTCLRLMLEYCQTENRYFEKPVGKFQKYMVQFWDDLFVLCEKYRLRILLTPFDTFWMRRRWKYHPYNFLNGGPCKSKTHWLTSPQTLTAMKNRFTFVIERWGGSGVLFGWDLWNEISPVNASGKVDGLYEFINEISEHIRQLEMKLYGKTHLQTVSVFAPLMIQHDMSDLIFRHPKLDFASTHFYENKTINYPKNTVDPALATGNMVREALIHLPENRPFFDSEHGPIDYFQKRRKNLPEDFDDQYFSNMQWAHLASGAAGGGMRWPYRHPHVLTHGMRRSQQNLSCFLCLIDWKTFSRINLNEQIEVSNPHITALGCGDNTQAIVWLLDTKNSRNKFNRELKEQHIMITIPGLDSALYEICFWSTVAGKLEVRELAQTSGKMKISMTMYENNLAVAIRKSC